MPRLNRYPGRGSFELTAALAARHGVPAAQVVVAAGADALIGYVCQAVLQPGDEVVVPWPSFPSFVRDPQKRDAIPVTVPLVNGGHVDLAALEAAVTPRTRLLFVATPNNPTGSAIPRDDLIAFVRGLPEHVLPVIDEAYFDYLDPGDRLDASPTSCGRATTCSRCAPSRSSTASRGSGSATASGPRRSSPRSGRCSAATTSVRSPRWLRSRASRTQTRSSGGGRRTGTR